MIPNPNHCVKFDHGVWMARLIFRGHRDANAVTNAEITVLRDRLCLAREPPTREHGTYRLQGGRPTWNQTLLYYR
jgi:hypothetical protein